MIKIRPLIEVLGKIIRLPKDSYIDPSSLGSGTADATTVLKGDSTWGTPESMGYVPYTGATQDVDLGTHGLLADFVAFDLNPVAAPGAGQIVYDGASGALSYLLNSSNVASRIGQTMHAYVRNAEGATITKGQAVYLYQASGNKASVKLAYNTSDATSAKTFGLAAEDIGAGQNGMVICQGVLDGLNTGMYTAGDTLYLGVTPGSYTTTKPYAPNHFVYIGIVERANNGNGQIYVRVQNGYELDEIHDVDLITNPPTDGQVLTYDLITGLWRPESIPSSVNIYNTNGTLTGSRTVSLLGNELIFGDNGTGRFTVNSDDGTNAVTIDASNSFGVVLSASSSGGAGLLSVTTAGINIGGFYTLPNTSGSSGQVMTNNGAGIVNWETIIPTEFVFVSAKSDLPTPVAGVITLIDNYTYFFTTTVDLTGDRLVCGINTTILGGSSENCRIKSTGLVGTALITSNYSLPMRNITIEADVALNLDGDGVTTALDWFGVNFTDCTTIGTIKDYSNFILQDSAFLNSGNLTFDGTIGTIAASQCLFNCNALGTVFILASTLTVTRRFRIVYSSFVVLAGEKGIDTTPPPSIPDDGFILNYCNFSGGGTYLDGFTHTSVKSLFINNVGITNTSNVGHNYMINNGTNTIIGVPNVNVWVKAAGATTVGIGNSPKWTQPVNNRLLYGGIISTEFIYNAVGTVQTGSQNQIISVAVAVNGTVQAESEVSVRTSTSNQPFPFAVQDVVQLVTGDYVEIFVKNSQSPDIRVGDLNVIIQKITG